MINSDKPIRKPLKLRLPDGVFFNEEEG